MAVSIKIDRLGLIKDLERRLKEIPAEFKAYEKAVENHKKALTTWAHKAAKVTKNIRYVGIAYTEEVTITLSKSVSKNAPKAPEAPQFSGQWQVKEAVKEITDTLKLLKLSTDDTVGTSVTKNIVQYL